MPKRRVNTQFSAEFINPWNDRRWIAYLTELLPRFRQVRMVGYPSIKDVQNTRIEQLYVQVFLSEKNVQPEAVEDLAADVAYIEDLLNEYRRVIVLGDPGAGKSTLIGYLTTLLASRRPNVITERFGQLIPLPFVLRDFKVGRDTTLDDLLNQFCQQSFWPESLTRGDLDHILKLQQALVFWDGLDEVGDIESRLALRNAFWQLAREYPDCFCVLTSRLVGYDDLPFDVSDGAGEVGDREAVRLVGKGASKGRGKALAKGQLSGKKILSSSWRGFLVPFQDAQIERFARNWYSAREEGDSEVAADEFMQAIRANPMTHRLARRPNLLTMMALIYRTRARLPNGRTMLYDEIADAYLHTIDEERKLKLLPYPLAEKKRWVAQVAYEMQRRRSTGDIQQDVLADEGEVHGWIVDAMQQSGYGGTIAAAAEFVNYIALRSGLLLPKGVQGQGRSKFAFVHLSFQEYFAAYKLAEHIQRPRFLQKGGQKKRPFAEEFQELASQDVWSETLFFLAEMMATREGWPEELAHLMFGEGFRFVDYSLKRSRPAAELAALLAVDPHSGWTPTLRSEAIDVCCRWQIEENASDKRFVGPKNSIVATLLQCDSGDQEYAIVHKYWEMLVQRGVDKLDLSNTSFEDVSIIGDLENVYSLDISDTQVCDLSGLKYIPKIKTLNVGGPQLSDLSPIRYLKGVTSLRVSGGKVVDLSPLANLKSLEQLSLVVPNASELPDLAANSKLSSLSIEDSRIGELSALSGLNELADFHIVSAASVDVSPLGGLRSLVSVAISCPVIQDVGPLVNCVNMEALYIIGEIEDGVSSVARMKMLKSLRLMNSSINDASVVATLAQLWMLDLDGTKVSDLTPLSRLVNLRHLDLRNTPVTDLRPLAKLESLSTLYLVKTQVKDVSPLVNLKKLKRIVVDSIGGIDVPISMRKSIVEYGVP